MTLTLSPAAVAAVNFTLSQSQVPVASRGSFKRVQKAVQPLTSELPGGGATLTGGNLELETADIEWLQFAVEQVAAWPGQIVGMDGDEDLKAAIKELLKPTTEGGYAKE